MDMLHFLQPHILFPNGCLGCFCLSAVVTDAVRLVLLGISLVVQWFEFPRFPCRGRRFHPQSGDKIPHAAQCSQKLDKQINSYKREWCFLSETSQYERLVLPFQYRLVGSFTVCWVFAFRDANNCQMKHLRWKQTRWMNLGALQILCILQRDRGQGKGTVTACRFSLGGPFEQIRHLQWCHTAESQSHKNSRLQTFRYRKGAEPSPSSH